LPGAGNRTIVPARAEVSGLILSPVIASTDPPLLIRRAQIRLFLLGRLTPYRRRARACAGWAAARSLTRPSSLRQRHSAYLYDVLCAGNVLICRRQGLPDCHGASTSSAGTCRAGSGHPDGGTDRRPRRRGRAAGTPARTIRVLPVSPIWSAGRRWAPVPRASSGPDPAGGHARERCGGASRQGAGGCGCPERSSSYSGITLNDEGWPGRTRADPPFGVVSATLAFIRSGTQTWLICVHGLLAQQR
jgi:hypothetical protein